MHTFIIVMYVIAVAAFALATAGVTSRLNLVALGLLAWVLTLTIPAIT